MHPFLRVQRNDDFAARVPRLQIFPCPLGAFEALVLLDNGMETCNRNSVNGTLQPALAND